MFAITTLIKSPDGNYRVENGVLFPSPVELRDRTRVAQYLKIDTPGWGVGDLGYHHFASSLPNGDLLVFPALELVGEPRARRRFPDFGPHFTKKQIEALASSYASEINAQEKLTAARINILVHDLRALSNAIYHAALEAQSLISETENREAYRRIENVIASQAMLKMRTDALDFEGNQLALDYSSVPIYRKVDKVTRCFKPRAANQGKSVELSGNSFRLARGPDIFELVPYALIDNGIKYAPRGAPVDVSVHDGDQIRMTVTSLGPRLKKTEIDAIFSRGIRAEAAQATGLPGHGIGLAMAKRIVTMFHGSIHVQQSQAAVTIDDDEYYETTFTVDIPSLTSR